MILAGTRGITAILYSIPLVVGELLRRGFEDLGMTTIWCAYYDGNLKSKRVQEKLGFVYHHTCNEVPVPLLHEVRVEHTNVIHRLRCGTNS